MKVILDTRPGSGYQDTIERYHFPSRYLSIAREAVGDWAIYYEPSREGGRRAYVAVARIERIVPDPMRPGHHFAVMADYLPFDAPVPLMSEKGYREEILRNVEHSSAIGRALQGRSIREIGEADFAIIVVDGLGLTLSPANSFRLGLADVSHQRDKLLSDDLPLERRVERMLVSRIIRDAAFRRAVLDAYDNTCAVTGLRIVNGGGKAEAQAAHIVPVSDGGPDVVQNGIALSATAHWLFDRHLISIGQDWRLLVSHNRVPVSLQNLFVPQDKPIHLPSDEALWPHPAFVARHRDLYASPPRLHGADTFQSPG